MVGKVILEENKTTLYVVFNQKTKTVVQKCSLQIFMTTSAEFPWHNITVCAAALIHFHINTTWSIFAVVLLKSLGDTKIHKISANNLNVRERKKTFFPLNCQLISYCQEELTINFEKLFHA